MVMVITFILLVLASSAFSAVAGGTAGRWTAASAVITTFMGVAISMLHPSFARVELWRVATDVIFLVSLVWLAVVYRKWWLIWMSAFQANGTAAHFAALLSPVHVKLVYYWLTTVWGIPILAVWVLGICKDRNWAIRPLAHAGEAGRRLWRSVAS